MHAEQSRTLELFFSYSHKNERLRDKLATQLRTLERQQVLTAWHDRRITVSTEWAGQIDEHLNTADISLLLVSADFIDSDYCWDVELARAMERHEAGEARVIPVILRPCDWKHTAFAKLQALPQDAKPITTCPASTCSRWSFTVTPPDSSDRRHGIPSARGPQGKPAGGERAAWSALDTR
jgi:hypothetical protein